MQRIAVAAALAIGWTMTGTFGAPAAGAQAFTFLVNDTRDLPDAAAGNSACETASGTCTLRAALEEISAVVPSCDVYDHVILEGARYLLAPGTPSLQVGGDACVHIEGTGANGKPGASVIDGNSPTGAVDDPRQYPVLLVLPGSTLVLNGVTVTRGHDHFPGGGGIRNHGNLTVNLSWIDRNTTHGRGGGIYNLGNLWINESTISNNWSRPNVRDQAGGGIANVGAVHSSTT